MPIIQRLLELPRLGGRSMFLWGPRKTGKTAWTRALLPDAVRIDLLQTDVYAEYAARPSLLRERFSDLQRRHRGKVIVIDEIQKCPALLDEVHGLIESARQPFVLTGSSARKLRREHANVLGGRAWRRELRPFCAGEVGALDLERVMLSGLLPPHFLSTDPREDLRAYVADYLHGEVALEAQRRDIPAFSDFLRTVAIANGALLNYANVARESGVSAKVVRSYFEILEDTLLGSRVSPWTRARTRRMILTEKFYLFDVGVTHHLSRRAPKRGTPEFGQAFEQLVWMELMAYRAYRSPDTEIRFWRTSTGEEVDFVLDDLRVGIETKSGATLHAGDLRGLIALADDARVRRLYVVCNERQRRVVTAGRATIQVLPWPEFVRALWDGEITDAR